LVILVVVQVPEVWLHLTLPRLVLLWSQQNYVRLLKTVRNFKSSSKAAICAALPRTKTGMKMNQ